jgi:glutathione synthase
MADLVFVLDPLATLLPHHDSTVALMQAAQQRGHTLWTCGIEDLSIVDGIAHAKAIHTHLHLDALPYYTTEERVLLSLDSVDAVFMRKDPPVSAEYLFATYILDRTKTLVVNRPQGLRDANEKVYTLNFLQYTPETLVTSRPAQVREFLKTFEKAILKPLDGKGGEGIFLLTLEDKNLNSLVETMTRFESRPVVVQRYLPEASLGDKRIILLDGEPLGAILRVPQSHEVRGNMRVGGQVVKAEITEHEREICAYLAPKLKADGLHFVGIDIIGSYLTEVNVTSPTGIQEVDQLNGSSIGATIIEWVENQLQRTKLAKN